MPVKMFFYALFFLCFSPSWGDTYPEPSVVVMKKGLTMEANIKCTGGIMAVQELGNIGAIAFCDEKTNKLSLHPTYIGDGRYHFYCGPTSEKNAMHVIFPYDAGDVSFRLSCYFNNKKGYVMKLNMNVIPQESVTNEQRVINTLGNNNFSVYLPVDVSTLPKVRAEVNANYVWIRSFYNQTLPLLPKISNAEISAEEIITYAFFGLVLILAIIVLVVVCEVHQMLDVFKKKKESEPLISEARS
jgi:hypothetical protein